MGSDSLSSSKLACEVPGHLTQGGPALPLPCYPVYWYRPNTRYPTPGKSHVCIRIPSHPIPGRKFFRFWIPDIEFQGISVLRFEYQWSNTRSKDDIRFEYQSLNTRVGIVTVTIQYQTIIYVFLCTYYILYINILSCNMYIGIVISWSYKSLLFLVLIVLCNVQ